MGSSEVHATPSRRTTSAQPGQPSGRARPRSAPQPPQVTTAMTNRSQSILGKIAADWHAQFAAGPGPSWLCDKKPPPLSYSCKARRGNSQECGSEFALESCCLCPLFLRLLFAKLHFECCVNFPRSPNPYDAAAERLTACDSGIRVLRINRSMRALIRQKRLGDSRRGLSAEDVGEYHAVKPLPRGRCISVGFLAAGLVELPGNPFGVPACAPALDSQAAKALASSSLSYKLISGDVGKRVARV
jgi:hypothetical protein